MVWKHVKGPGARIFWGYIAAVMLIAMLSPGMAVFAEEGASAPEVTVADEASPPAEEAVVDEVPPAPEPAEEPIVAPPAEESVVAEPATPEPIAVAATSRASVVPMVAHDDPSDLGVVPILTEGNPKLCDGGVRIEDPSGTKTREIPGHPGKYVTAVVTDTDDGPIFSFDSDVPIIRVVAKGGNVGANIYPYSDYPELQPVYADGNLHAPVNPSGKYAGLSHIDFCFGDEPIPTDIKSRKWYDANKDGNWWLPEGGMDPGEYFIAGWRIELWEKDGTEPLRVTYTDDNGWYLFEDVPPGEYIIKEELPEGWEQTHPLLKYGRDYWPVTLVGDGRVLECETPFGNVREEVPPEPGCIKVVKFEDANENGIADLGEDTLPGWEFSLKDATGAIIATGITGPDGVLMFCELEPGEYTVVETVMNGWSCTTHVDPEGVAVVAVVAGETTEVWFGNHKDELPPEPGCIKVVKFEDANENGIADLGEDTLPGWEFSLKDATGAIIATGITGPDGVLMFCELEPGEYTVVETVMNGWSCTTHVDPEGVAVVAVVAGETTEVWFGNYKEEVPPELGSIIVYKYEDANGNEQYDEGEKMLEDWEFSLDYAEQANVAALAIDSGLTDEYGELVFDDLRPGLYMVTETLKEGWINTTGLTAIAQVVAGEQTEVWFGNRQEEVPPDPGSIKVFKFYDTDGDGVQDAGEAGLSGWVFDLRDAEGAIIRTGATDAAGVLIFSDLDPGTYTVTERLRSGWEYTTGSLSKTVVVVSGQQTGVLFGNRETEEEEFLPFTGGEYVMLLSVALAAAVFGLLLRLRSDRAA